MICPACNEDKELFPATFNLFPGWDRYKCQECIDNRIEPRFTIVLAALLKSSADYMDVITEHRYYGEPIQADEILPKRKR